MKFPLNFSLTTLRLVSLFLFIGVACAPNVAAQHVYLSPPTVYSFTLVDSKADEPVPGFDPIPDGAVLNLNQLPHDINIRANTVGNVKSVRFSFKEQDTFRIETNSPFALFGDIEGDYSNAQLAVGEYELNATPYANKKGIGDPGHSATISFQVVRQGPTMVLEEFVLVDAETNSDLFPIEEGTELNLAELPEKLNIRAAVMHPAKSVRWLLIHKETDLEYYHLESVRPFSLFGDIDGDYLHGKLRQGTYILMANAFDQVEAHGNRGDTLLIHFHVTDQLNPSPTISDASISSSQNATEQPGTFGLNAAYPNPFNPTTTIGFSLPISTHTSLVVYDMLGREVATLINDFKDAGKYEIAFDADNLPSGKYLYRLSTPEFSAVKQITLLK